MDSSEGREAGLTGGKEWCPGLIHHKSIQNVPSQFPCSVPGSGNGWYIHSVPDHVTRMSPSGTSWEHPKFSQRKYPEFS